MKKYAFWALSLLVFAACEPVTEEPDSNLYGTWSNLNGDVIFRTGETYSQTFNRVPIRVVNGDSIGVDSIAGSFTVDSKRKNIQLDIRSYRQWTIKNGDYTSKIISNGTAPREIWTYERNGNTLKITTLAGESTYTRQ